MDMQPVHVRPARRAWTFRRPRSFAVVAALAVLGGLLGAGVGPASAATVTVVHPGANLITAISALRAGDTLQLAAGTYSQAYMRITMAAGTAAAPITVTAQDPAHPPLILGGLELYSPTYVAIRHLRIQGTFAGLAGLNMVGGTGWIVDSTEVWGAQQTLSLANVVIGGSGGYPRNFTFSQNCVHDAANSTNPDQVDHNVYVTFPGSTTTSGTITRNIMWDAPHGENIKIGNGGLDGALGAWNVRVSNNTLVTGGRQLLLHANVRNTTVIGNLFYDATQGFVASPKTTQVYIHDVIGTGNTFSYNYSAAATMFIYDPKSVVTLGVGNVTGANPAFTGVNTCAGWKQTLAAALPYGRWGTSSFVPLSVPPSDRITGPFWH